MLRLMPLAAMALAFPGANRAEATDSASTPAASAAESARESTAWQAITAFRFNEALPLFLAGEPPAREALFGAAMARLQEQPRTAARIARASEELASLAVGDDEVAQAAAYYHARAAAVHAEPADRDLALQRYAALWADHPESFWGQLALLKLATAAVFSPGLTPAKRFEDVQAYAALAPLVTSPVVRRNLHRTLAEACVRMRLDDAFAYTQLEAALAIDFDLDPLEDDLRMTIAETARRLGRFGVAREHYRTFVAANPRDARCAYARDRIAELGALLDAE